MFTISENSTNSHAQSKMKWHKYQKGASIGRLTWRQWPPGTSHPHWRNEVELLAHTHASRKSLPPERTSKSAVETPCPDSQTKIPLLNCPDEQPCTSVQHWNFQCLSLLLGTTSKTCTPWEVIQLLSQGSSSAQVFSPGTVSTGHILRAMRKANRGTQVYLWQCLRLPTLLETWINMFPSSTNYHLRASQICTQCWCGMYQLLSLK